MSWYEEIPSGKSWASLWSGYTICATCHGIRGLDGKCPVCESDLQSLETRIVANGREIVTHTVMGAEGQFEDYLYLQMLEREWKRPAPEDDNRLPNDPTSQLSPRATIVILFWSYFETRVERLIRAGMHDVPQRLAEDTLRRYTSIGSRLDRLYRVLFDTTYAADLTDLGFDDIRRHLAQVQERRNAFAHGDPTAIDDSLVMAVIDNLKRDHDAWIAVYNRRGTKL